MDMPLTHRNLCSSHTRDSDGVHVLHPLAPNAVKLSSVSVLSMQTFIIIIIIDRFYTTPFSALEQITELMSHVTLNE